MDMGEVVIFQSKLAEKKKDNTDGQDMDASRIRFTWGEGGGEVV